MTRVPICPELGKTLVMVGAAMVVVAAAVEDGVVVGVVVVDGDVVSVVVVVGDVVWDDVTVVVCDVETELVAVVVTPHVPLSTYFMYQQGSPPSSLLPLNVLSMAVTLAVSQALRFCLKLSA